MAAGGARDSAFGGWSALEYRENSLIAAFALAVTNPTALTIFPPEIGFTGKRVSGWVRGGVRGSVGRSREQRLRLWSPRHGKPFDLYFGLPRRVSRVTSAGRVETEAAGEASP